MYYITTPEGTVREFVFFPVCWYYEQVCARAAKRPAGARDKLCGLEPVSAGRFAR